MDTQLTPDPAAARPRPFPEVPRLWLALPRMTVSFFAEELPRASASATTWSVICLAIFVMIAAPLPILIRRMLQMDNQKGWYEGFGAVVGWALVLSCLGLLSITLGFYIRNGLIHAAARELGGKGSFANQAYLVSLSFVPLEVVSWFANFLQLLPRVGGYLPFVVQGCVFVVGMLLEIRAVKVAHRLSMGRAVGAVLIPFALLLIPLCIIGILILMGPIIGSTFSTINASLSTPAPP